MNTLKPFSRRSSCSSENPSSELLSKDENCSVRNEATAALKMRNSRIRDALRNSEIVCPSAQPADVEKRFRFELDNNTVEFVPAIADMSFEEIEETWFSQDDYYRIRLRLNAVMRMMQRKSGEATDDNNSTFSFRGLESRYSIQLLEQRRVLKSRIVNAILGEQREQKRKGKTNPERIAKLYRSLTKASVYEGLLLGKLDAEAAGNDVPNKMSSYHIEDGINGSSTEKVEPAMIDNMFKKNKTRRVFSWKKLSRCK